MDKNKQLIAYNKESGQEHPFVLGEGRSLTCEYGETDAKLEYTSDGFSMITMNGTSYPVEIVSHYQNECELLVNGVGYLFSVETPFSMERKKLLAAQAGESTAILLKAPMPGKILEVMVETGDAVKAGDTLLILEAMKMQNAILASTKGIIKKVHVKVGDTTSKSDLLIELQKEA